MKVIAVNGSPHKEGNTWIVLSKMSDIMKEDGIETEILQIGAEKIHGCVGCGHCQTSDGNKCVFKDDVVNEASLKMREADGIILGAPTYYAGIPGAMKCFLDRVFYSSKKYFNYKVATPVAVVRRAGGVDVVHQLMNYLHLAETVTPPSQYWTVVYGRTPGEVLQDGEGIQTITKNARSLAWLLKVIEASSGKIPTPAEESRVYTHFVR
ncbi:MAG: flavodoxin family protein [Synergistaceae bacterium]|jgi:multimeric flavodoxin WrbA|nr:flavodoxin family protein [Synergistaceae bacterium]